MARLLSILTLALVCLNAVPAHADDATVVKASNDETAKAIAAAVNKSGVKLKPVKALEGKSKAEAAKLIQAEPNGLHIGQAGVQLTSGSVTLKIDCKPFIIDRFTGSEVVCTGADGTGNVVKFSLSSVAEWASKG